MGFLHNGSSPIELLSAANALTDPSNASKLKVSHWDGFVEEFELTTWSEADWAGLRRTNRIGNDLTIDYTGHQRRLESHLPANGRYSIATLVTR